MPFFNKLVRDKIPAIITASGQVAKCRVLAEADFLQALRAKIVEEAQELVLAKDDGVVGEVADLLEVVSAFVDAMNLTMEEIETERERKLLTRGGFSDRVFLVEVEEH